MKRKATTVFLILLAVPALAAAQTKISGTVKCGNPDQQSKLDIGDKPGHAFAISQGKCTWTKPMEIAGIQTKEDVDTSTEEITTNKVRASGYVLGTMSNGDKFIVRTDGTDTMKDGKPEGTSGTWKFVSGTGKIKGIKGGGKFTGKPDAEGAMVIEVEGEYTLPKPK
jgi:hypothetical protein